jgi:hypothetical protein
MRRRKFITLLGGALFACPHFVKRRVPLEHSGINVRIVELSAPPDFDKSFEIALNEQVGARHPRATIASLAIKIAGFLQALAERRDLPAQQPGRSGAHDSDQRHRRLLRARGERPKKRWSDRRAAEQRDELAAFHHQVFPARLLGAARWD